MDSDVTGVLIDPELIQVGLSIRSKEEGLRLLSGKLSDLDLVGQGFYEHLIERERTYPTGLPTSIPVALCHTEAVHVKHSALAVATLKTPVPFEEMGSPGVYLPVEVIFLLALKDPKDQVSWLKRMVSAFRDSESLSKIRHAPTAEDLSQYLRYLFGDQDDHPTEKSDS